MNEKPKNMSLQIGLEYVIAFSIAICCGTYVYYLKGMRPKKRTEGTVPLLACIRNRRSVFPRHYKSQGRNDVSSDTMKNILEAAMWAPFHGSVPPWRFVVLGKRSMREMQRVTLNYYDANWKETGWANGKRGSESVYRKWRKMTEDEIEGRWGPVSYMVAIIMRRQAGSKRIPEWEEAAATAAAVQNMHIQACATPGLASYWSSWHDAVRDSDAMHTFLNMKKEDKCLGFFIVATCDPNLKDLRKRSPTSHLSCEWRP